MKYAAISVRTNSWIMEDESYQAVQAERKRLAAKGIITTLVAVLETEDDPIGSCPWRVHAPRQALEEIVNAANANPVPIHYNVKAAIDRARELLRG